MNDGPLKDGPSPSADEDARQYLSVPFEFKDKVKALGGLWDPVKKSWYNPDPIGNIELNQLMLSMENERMKRMFLAVPFGEKDEAKLLGAKWDSKEKQWYNPDPVNNIQLNKWTIKTKDTIKSEGSERSEEINLIGEDRDFGGNLLFVDLIPSSCWFTNVRSCVHPSDWNLLRKYVYSRANNQCECCHSSSHGIEAHERWEYNNEIKIQKLVRLVALCTCCHEVTHIGLSGIRGKSEETKKHLKKIRNFSSDDFNQHVSEAFFLFEERSRFEWTLDLTLLTNNGIKLKN